MALKYCKPVHKKSSIRKDFEVLLPSPTTPLPEFVKSVHQLKSKSQYSAAKDLKNLLLLIDFTNARSEQVLLRISRYTNELVTSTNFVSVDRRDDIDFIIKKAADKKIIFIIDSTVDLLLVKKHLFKCSEVIFCCNTPKTLENKFLSRFIIALGKLAEKSNGEPKHLILDFVRDTLVFHNRIRLLGFLDWEALARIPKFNGKIQIYVPGITRLEMNHDLIDNFINSILERCTMETKTPSGCFHKLVTYFDIHFPDLVSIGSNHSITREPKTNTIDLSMARLHILMKHNVEMKLLFRIHSLTDWILPRIKDFAGQEILLCPQEISFLENLRLLNRMISIRDSGSKTWWEFEIDLFPKETKNTVILNWMVNQTDSFKIFHTGWKFKSNRLETLAIKPMVLPGTLSFSIRGIYAENLKKLELINDLRVPPRLQNRPAYTYRSTRKLCNKTTYQHTRRRFSSKESTLSLDVTESLRSIETNRKFPVTFALQNAFQDVMKSMLLLEIRNGITIS